MKLNISHFRSYHNYCPSSLRYFLIFTPRTTATTITNTPIAHLELRDEGNGLDIKGPASIKRFQRQKIVLTLPFY